MKKILIVSTNSDLKKIFKSKSKNIIFIQNQKKFSYEKVKKLNPKIIFFVYWHWKISSKIFKKYLCIGFHSSPLPYGRGGSPIQNMILKGNNFSKVCAIRIQEKLDSGDIYLKQNISLKGNLDDIWIKINKKIFFMIRKIIKKIPTPQKQIGKVVFFKRLKPEQSLLFSKTSLKKIYDQIRMRDTKLNNIHSTFINYKNLKISFKNAKYNKKEIFCETKISFK
jgi:methionyl-tRNA formyltransferase